MAEKSREGGGNPEVKDAPRHDAFATQRRALREKDRKIEGLEKQLEEKEFSGDPSSAAIDRKMRNLEDRLDVISMQGIDEDQVEEVMAENPWISRMSNKADRIQAVKDLIARGQRAETNAGDPPVKGRSKSEAANLAHLTGGGPPAGSPDSRGDEEMALSKLEKDLSEAKTQVERDRLSDEHSKKYGE